MQLDKDPEELAATYEQRNETLQAIIDKLAEHEQREYSEHGFKTDLADEIGVDSQQVHYVLDNWMELVRFRRAANRNPLDEGVAQDAYDDPILQKMAEGSQTAMADGAGGITSNYELSLDEVFRCIKLLPSDLGSKFFSQTIQNADEIPAEVLARLMEADNE